ncbi:hypothetical protein K439DRAFT_1662788 [Ramaria rubella]|nr:hypothetical protein K439DRAFT_1662788 [Ramaria rubella]
MGGYPTVTSHGAASVEHSAGAGDDMSLHWQEVSKSILSSGVPGPGYYSGKALKWIGDKALDAIETLVINRRAAQHLSQLKRWNVASDAQTLRWGSEERQLLSRILGDALVMSRPCYPRQVIGHAVEIYRHTRCLILTMHPRHFNHGKFKSVICVALSVLEVIESSYLYSGQVDFIWDLLDVVTKIPVGLHDAETAFTVVCLFSEWLPCALLQYESSNRGYFSLRLLRTVINECDRTLNKHEWVIMINLVSALLIHLYSQQPYTDDIQLWTIPLLTTLLTKNDNFTSYFGRPRTRVVMMVDIIDALYRAVNALPEERGCLLRKDITWVLQSVRGISSETRDWYEECMESQ